jgi:formylglycine-generating enzyme required for sulfatase activity
MLTDRAALADIAKNAEVEDVRRAAHAKLWKMEEMEESLAERTRAESSLLKKLAAKVAPNLGIEMVVVSAGYFKGEDRNAVYIMPFLLGKHEVTQAQWEAVMGNNPSVFKKSGADAPVENVSWDDAMAFCKKLNERERAAGRLPGGYEYTLPTEAQWEYACRAGSHGDYGKLADGSEGKLDEMGWYNRNSGGKTHPVGQKKPNAWGLYDMHGNVREWCLDEEGSFRVYRGGGWFTDASHCRSDDRKWGGPGSRVSFLGFRLALCAVGGK